MINVTESVIGNVFSRCYLIIKFNLIFLFFTFSGGIIFVIAPAYYVVTRLYKEGGWEILEQKNLIKRGWQYYKKYFFKINQLAGIHALIAVTLLVNLFISVQQRGLFFFMLTLFILFIFILNTLVFQYSLQIAITYSESIKKILYLATAVLFADFKELMAHCLGLFLLFLLLIKAPALLLFGIFSLQIIWTTATTKKRTKLVSNYIR